MSGSKLGRDVYLALTAVGWADGTLDADEGAAILRLANEEGLDADEIAEIEAATKSPVEISSIDRGALTKDDRLFIYAVASWMTRLDGSVTEAETERLAQLGEALRVPERPRYHADAIAQEVAAMPDGSRPARFDLRALRSIISERLAAAQAARANLQTADGGGPSSGES